MIPFDCHEPDFEKKSYTNQWGKFIKAWPWHDENGNILFYTARYETENGKSVIPFKYENEWKPGQSISDNRPLLGLYEIIKTEKEILLVEGEKCYDAAWEKLGDEFCVTTWCGGTGGIVKTDWNPIKDKTVYYWFDNDDPGRETIDFLRGKLNKLILVEPPREKPKTWDIADAFYNDGWSAESALLHIRQFGAYEKKTESIPEDREIKFPFQFLGVNSGYYYFLQNESEQIFKVKEGSLNNGSLLHLASLEFWSENFGYETKAGQRISWINAQDMIIRESNKMPAFDYNKIRGRGIWQEKDYLIIHTGNKLVFGEKEIDIKDYSVNGHIYERMPRLNLNIIKSEISDFELYMVKDCIDNLSIQSELEKIFFTGWCVLAPFCGALEWRPHIWITGPAGSGKTAILKMIVHKMLGDFCLYAEGDSTGAGIIQNIKNDSFSVIHDEVDKGHIDNLKFELEIARSSSYAGGNLFKGTADQSGKRYNYNIMFCLSSINHILEKKSDRSRFSIINITKNLKIKWKDFKHEIISTFKSERCEKIRSRFFYNWKIVRESIDNFRDECGISLGDQRLGDQIGTLLAGYCLLYDMKEYKTEEIKRICEKYRIMKIENEDTVTDELELLMKIFTTKIRYIGYENKIEDTTLLNLLKRAAGIDTENTHDTRAEKELYKYGIRLEKNKIYIAYKYEWIKNILTGTPWVYNYGDILKRLSFVQQRTEAIRFGNYYHGRALIMKADPVLRLSDDSIYMEAGF